MQKFSIVCLLLASFITDLFAQSESDVGAAPLVVTKFWHPWMASGSPDGNFLFPFSCYSVTDDGLWVSGYFNKAEKGKIFKINLSDFKTESFDTSDGKLTTNLRGTPKALYTGIAQNDDKGHTLYHGIARYDLTTQTWATHDLPINFLPPLYLIGDTIYLSSVAVNFELRQKDTGVFKYDWDTDKLTLLASSRRRPGLNQFDDTAPYTIDEIFSGPANKPCLTVQSGTYYIQESPGPWPAVFDDTFGGMAAPIPNQTLVLNPQGEVTLMDPKSDAPIPLMAASQPIYRKPAAAGAPAVKVPTPWASQTLWDSPEKDSHMWKNNVGLHGDYFFILQRPAITNGAYQLLCYQKGKGRNPRVIPLQFQLDAPTNAVLSKVPGKIPNGWQISEIEHPEPKFIPELITTNQGLCVKLMSAGFWFIPYSDIEAYLVGTSPPS